MVLWRALTDALEKLNSDKIKVRTEGLAALRTTLESDTAIARLDPNGDNTDWLPILQALHSCVTTEKASAQKKTTKSAASSGAAAERRAGEAARTLRWLVERAAHRLNKKSAHLVLAHLANTSAQGNALYTPVALDYAKAARAMLTHAPHADHLKEEMWERLAQLSWNVVLGDSLRRPVDDVDDDETAMDVDSEASGAEDELPGSGSKRRRTDDRTSPPKRARTAASLEQIEFCSLLATLHNISSAPLCTPTPEGEDVRADALLAKHARFLSTQPADSSLHADHLTALAGTLSRIALNRSQQTCAFARKAWPRLVALWTGRNRALKSSLLPVLRALYPFYAVNEDCESGLVDLWGVLEGDKGAEALGIDALRLRLGGFEGPFATKTFRHGRGFGPIQASAWVALEMQANCAAKLFVTGENVLQTPTPRTPRAHQATRRNDPLGALLSGRPSALLFFVAHHWSIVPPAMRTKAKKALLQSVSSSAADSLGAGAGGEKAAWAFLSLAAVAEQESPCTDVRTDEVEGEMKEFWPTIWAHALRRLPHPLLSRPAAHTAYALLTRGFIPPTTLRPSLLTLVRDLPVQSPPAAVDSVCAFLSECVEVARADVSLFRAGIGEAVLGWATDMEMLRTRGWVVSDVLRVLVRACGLKEVGTDGKEGWWSEDGERGEDEMLPECAIVELVRREARESQIRGYVLEAEVPPFVPSNVMADDTGMGRVRIGDGVKENKMGKSRVIEVEGGELGQPGTKERKVSASISRLLESLQPAHDTVAHPSAHKARATLDSAVLALCFEAALVLNNVHPNERVLRAAAKLIQSHTALIRGKKWSDDEVIEVLGGLEPLVQGWSQLNGDGGGDEDYSGAFGDWEVMHGPCVETGVGQDTLRRLGVISETHQGSERAKLLQRIIWQSADLQDAMTDITTTMHKLLDQTLTKLTGTAGGTATNAFADDDGFGAIRAAPLAVAPSESQLQSGRSTPHALLRVTTAFLARGPVLQSTSGAASRERALTDTLLRTGDAEFLLAFPSYIAHVRAGTLALAPDALDALLEKFGGILNQHVYSKHTPALSAAAALLDGTMHLWLAPGFDDEVLLMVQTLLHHLGELLNKYRFKDPNEHPNEDPRNKNQWRDWRVRDALGGLFAQYIVADPMEEAWYKPADGEDREMAEDRAPLSPFRLIMQLNSDPDIRVRMRVAGPSAELLKLQTLYGMDAMTVYEDIKDNLTIFLTNHQHMLTRILVLGNAIVVSGAVARGPYWHILETCIFTPEFNAHIQAVFKAVAARMGLAHHRLFEVYAGQIACSLAINYPDKQAEQDFLNIEPAVIGYEDQRAFASASFRSFAPAYVFDIDSVEQRASGRARFARHCSLSGLSVAEGVRAAFPDIVASDAIFCVTNKRTDTEDRLRVIFDDWGGFTYDAECLHDVVDAVLVAILRQLKGENHQNIIDIANERFPGRSLPSLFAHMLGFRLTGKERVYPENLPAEKAEIIFDALGNISARLPAHTIDVAVSYHIMRQLVADIYAQPLVNEQLRSTCALALWVALRWRHFREPMLLQALSHAASLLLVYADLARAAQGLLSFAFYLYAPQGDNRPPPMADTRLCDVLVRVCSITVDYANSGDEELSAVLTTWLYEELKKLLKISGTRQQVLRALIAWPREIPPEFEAELQKAQASTPDASALSLTGMLADPRVSANKFRIVRRLAEAPAEPHEGHFARLDFWRLKECIPPRGQLAIADVDAFCSLVFAHAGAIHGFGTHPLSPQVERHLPSRVQKPGPGGLPDANEIEHPERVIIEHLLCALDATDPRKVQTAYAVLRTAPATKMTGLKDWHREFASEWAYFAAAPRPAREAAPYELKRLSELRGLARDFPAWVCALTSALCDAIAGGPGGQYAFFAQLPPALREDAGLATQVLPVLVHALLRHGHGTDAPRQHLSGFLSDALAAPDTAVSTLKAIVDVALHMRNFYPPKAKDMLANERWLDVDRMLLSRAALRCGAYTTALLFYELEFARDGDDQRPKPDDTEAEDILFAIYSHVDEPDGFYGIHTHDLQRFLLRRFQHERQWDRAFMFHGAAFEAGSGAMAGVRESLHAFGFDRLALNVSGGAGEGMSYALGWRTEAWDLPDVAADDDPDAGLYRALRTVHCTSGLPPAEDALQDAVDRLRRLGDEDLVGIRQAVRSLLCASQVRTWCGPALQENLTLHQLEPARWEHFLDTGPGFDFETMEHLVATRMSLLSAARQRAQRSQIGDRPTPFTAGLAALEKRCLVRVSEAARESGALQIALNAVVRAQRLDASEKSSSVAQEFANVLWAKGEHKLAIQFLREIVASLPTKTNGDPALLEQAVLRSRLGSWSSEACMEKPAVIWDTYLQPAIDHLQSHADAANNASSAAAAARIFHECAVFADRHYHALSRSPDIVRRKIYIDRKQQEVRDLELRQRRTGLSRDEERGLSKARLLLKADTEAFAQHVEAQRAFLYQAASLYARSLSHSSLFDDDAHVRLVSLWYSNFDDVELAKRLGIVLDDVPSHKFVFLSHQLTARLAKIEPPEQSSSSSSRRKSRAMDSPAPAPPAPSQAALQRLVLRMCEDHPFHTVYQLFPLRPTNSEALSEGRRTSGRLASQSQTPSQGVRAAAAGDIFARLHEGRTAQRVSDVQMLCDASLQWAEEKIRGKVDNKSPKPFPVPDDISLPSIPQKVKVPISTARTPIDPTGRYDHCVWLESYETTFSVAGGQNLPKIHACHGSDGKRYVQLFKGEGEDDMRQDAVMEQVFDLVNIALRRDRETKRRSLNVRTYCVLPLAEQAGILEFVENTKPLGDILESLHKRYRPDDITDRVFASKMKEKRDKYGRGPVAELQRRMHELWNLLKPKLRPVMRHWFTVEHKVPMSWFAMRLNYARSLATTSIVGHALGLGDRHTKNILLDKSTGEAVNIDLGIAFDQGKLLPVPELVPFRLTEDMVDGLGTSGPQGVFQRCAEETLRVLRTDREVVLTILEVFKYDPLHSWVANDSRLTRAQDEQVPISASTNHAVNMLGGVTLDMNSGGAEEAADRALSAVARKLDAALSVEHTVNELIHEASDPANLCMMYTGWSPFL